MTRKTELISHILTISISVIVVTVMIILICITPSTFEAKLGKTHTATVEHVESKNGLQVIYSREYAAEFHLITAWTDVEKVVALKSGDQIEFRVLERAEYMLIGESDEKDFAILYSLKVNGEELIDQAAWSREEKKATIQLMAACSVIGALFSGFCVYGVVKLIKIQKATKILKEGES